MTLLTLLVVPLLSAACLGLAARALVRVLPPRTAVWSLVGAGLIASTASGFVLSVTAFGALAQNRRIATLGHWSAPVLHRHDPLSTGLGLAIAAIVGVLIARTFRFLARWGREAVTAERLCRTLGDGVDGLVVLPDRTPDAYTLQALSGRVVVTRGMLAGLPPAERAAMLAHERSHLDHRHSLLVAVARLSATANPLLTPLVAAVGLGVERWADEDAALATDRRLAARAVARAALAAPAAAPRGNSMALAMAGQAVARTTGLLAGPPRPRRAVTAGVIVIALLAGASAVAAGRTTEQSFEQAQSAAVRQ